MFATGNITICQLLFFVITFSACVVICENNRYRREESVTPSSTPSGTTETFYKFLDDLMNDLGLDSPDSDLTAGDSSTNVSDSLIQSTTTPSQSNEVISNDSINTGTLSSDHYGTGATESIVATLGGSISQIVNTGDTVNSDTPSPSSWPQDSLGGPASELSDTSQTESHFSSPSSWVPDAGTGSPAYAGSSSFAPSPPASNTSPTSSDINPNCLVRPVISDFCIIPESMEDFLGPSADLHDMSDFVVSMHLVHELTDKCPPGSWCLNSVHAYKHLEEKMAFWSNSSDFADLCWQPLDGCLRSIVEYYADCHIYPMYDLIVETKKLLCQMREEPVASRDCMEQTMKALHVSMADFHRDDIIPQMDIDTCDSRNALMTANYLCAVHVCGEYTSLLDQFKPWEYFMADVTSLTGTCNYDNDKCIPDIEEEADEAAEENISESDNATESVNEDEGSNEYDDGNEGNREPTTTESTDDEREYNAILALSNMDFPTLLVVGAVLVAALGFFLLLGVVWCLRRRKSKYRVREGVEYMEILPDLDD